MTLTDASGASASRSYALVIEDATPTIATNSLSAGEFVVVYNQTVAVLGGFSPYTWSATGLPTGLAINPTTGAITGTPTGAGFGTFTVTVTVTDSIGRPDTKVLTLTINPHITTVECYVRRNVSVTGTYQLQATGTTGSLTWSGSPGVGSIIVNSSGSFSGAPSTTIGAFVFALTVTDAAGRSSTSNFTINVRPGGVPNPLC